MKTWGKKRAKARNTGESSAYALLPLTPSYSEDDHALYVEHLRQALAGPNQGQIRNIALTGSYGIGKSSILESITREFDNRTVLLSMSTLGDNPHASGSTDSTEKPASTITNRIQKEIVKQLLYRESPSKIPGSRYRRMRRFRWIRETLLSLIVAAPLVLVIYLTGFARRLTALTGDSKLLHGGIYLGLFAFVGGLVTAFRYIFHNRIWIEKLSAGPAAISLSNKDDSYFDEYLDEILYFFEMTKCDIVIFEDIDRFDEPHIFETLRELNTILNRSKQLQGRNTRFIYAIKDSIFEQLGTVSFADETLTDAGRSELARANRTKFFDLVIPVVPFITHRNARDLMSKILEDSNLEISRELVDLAAKHLADMRLIKNIHNEFKIFKEHLLREDRRVLSLTNDSLFAMILYKNIHLSDFEQIKFGTSSLDDLYTASRDIVTENIKGLDRRAHEIRRRLTKLDSIATRSEDLGDRLEAYVKRVMRHYPAAPMPRTGMTLANETVSDSDLRSAEFWKKFTGNRGPLIVTPTVYQPSQNLQFTLADVREALNEELLEAEWEQNDRDNLQAQLAGCQDDKTFLLHADMCDLFGRPEFQLAIDGRSMSFAEVAKKYLQSDLAIELIASGYIDRNFTLYVSQYYGVHVSAQAMNFILHNVHHNVMDEFFQFSSEQDIYAVLREYNPASLGDHSVYNIEIVDYLLKVDDQRIEPIVNKLATWGPDEQTFMQSYLTTGNQCEELFRRLSMFWPHVFSVAVGEMEVDQLTRLAIVNASLQGADAGVQYDIDDNVTSYIEKHYTDIDVLTGPVEPSTAKRVIGLLGRFEVEFVKLEALGSDVAKEVVKQRLYTLTERNMVIALGGRSDLALDSVKSLNKDVYEYAMDNLDTYLGIVLGAEPNRYTINSAELFVEILHDAAARDESSVGTLVGHSAPECQVADISQVVEAAWCAMAKECRFPSTFSNVAMYVARRGDIDDCLAITLKASRSVTEHEGVSESEKQDLAIHLINARTTLPDPDLRVQLVEALNLDQYIDVGRLTAEEGPLIGLLIREGLIEDSMDSYTLTRNLSWPTREFTIQQSENFDSYITPADVSGNDLVHIMGSNSVRASTKLAILSRLSEFGAGKDRHTLGPIAEYALSNRVKLGSDALQTLAAARVRPDTVVRLLEIASTTAPPIAIPQILKSMGEPYERLAEHGRHRVKVPNDRAHIALIERLKQLDLVSSDDSKKGRSTIIVYMKRGTPR